MNPVRDRKFFENVFMIKLVFFSYGILSNPKSEERCYKASLTG